MYELPRDGRHHRFPSLLAHPAGDLLRAFAFGTFAAEADQHESRLEYVEIAALEMTGGGVAPDRDIVVLIEADGGHIVGAAALELHVADNGSPGSHNARIAGKEVAMQHVVGIQVVAGDPVRFVDRNHLGVLGHCRLEIEFDARVRLVVQRAHYDRAGVDPPVVFGRAEEHVPERPVVVRNAPSARLGCGRVHGLSVLASIEVPNTSLSRWSGQGPMGRRPGDRRRAPRRSNPPNRQSGGRSLE